MTMLPAPYESVPDDDLGAAVAAALTATLAAVTAINLGLQSWQQSPEALDRIKAGALSADAVNLVISTAGWLISVFFLAVGAVLLLLRRGRGAVIVGALVGLGTTVLARYKFEYFTAAHPLANSWLYFGGAAVVVAALLPATGRWIRDRRQVPRGGMPALTSATVLVPTQLRIGQAR